MSSRARSPWHGLLLANLSFDPPPGSDIFVCASFLVAPGLEASAFGPIFGYGAVVGSHALKSLPH